MENNEQVLKKKLQIIITSAMVLFFCLVTVVAFQFAIRLNQRNIENNLLQQRGRLQQQLSGVLRDLEHFEDHQRFIEEYALTYLNLTRPRQ